MKYYPNTEKVYKILGINLPIWFFDYYPNKPYVLFLHGLRNDTLKMMPIIDLIKPHYNVIAFDFPGHGKSKEWGKFDNYLDYGADITSAIIKRLKLKTKDLIIVGGSYGANVIIKMLMNDENLQFKKAGLMAPLYSEKTLIIPPMRKKMIFGFSRLMSKNGISAKIVQKIIDNDRMLTYIIKLFTKKPYTHEYIEHEKRLWKISPIEVWGSSVIDTITLDNSKYNRKIIDKDVTFIYPQADQYLNIDEAESGYKKIFPNAEFKRYKSKQHMPKGDFGKNKEFMKSMEKIILGSME